MMKTGTEARHDDDDRAHTWITPVTTQVLVVFSGSWLLCFFFFFSSRRRHTRCYRDWSSDVCSSDLMIRDATVTGVQTCALPICLLGVEPHPARQVDRGEEDVT